MKKFVEYFKESTLVEKFLFPQRLVIYATIHLLAAVICLLIILGWGFDKAAESWDHIIHGT